MEKHPFHHQIHANDDFEVRERSIKLNRAVKGNLSIKRDRRNTVLYDGEVSPKSVIFQSIIFY